MTTAPHIPLPPTAAPTVWVAAPSGAVIVVDAIAVEQAVHGHRAGWVLTRDEMRWAAGFMIGHVPATVIGERLGTTANTLRAWFPPLAVNRAPAECGTRRGYLAHRYRKEPACAPCRGANTAADRAYRLGKQVTA